LTNGVHYKYFLLFALCISLICFLIDYTRYLIAAKIEYLNNLCRLKELSNENRLVENDIRKFVKDDSEAYKDQIISANKVYLRKGSKIASYIKEYNFKVNKALNVGCGGEPSMGASIPYFNAGYDMIGVDVSEEYLKYFSKTFNTDAVYANGLCLPFKDNAFELVNYTDILEHLTDPVLGLTEIHRVLTAGGIIILSTPNRSHLKYRSINPFVLAGQLVGIYCESVLPPRDVIAKWMDFQFYHTSFARRELIKLMETTGFRILRIETRNTSYKIINLLEHVPVLKYLCYGFLVIGQK
jgi:SAM-dependent methyltransferase